MTDTTTIPTAAGAWPPDGRANDDGAVVDPFALDPATADQLGIDLLDVTATPTVAGIDEPSPLRRRLRWFDIVTVVVVWSAAEAVQAPERSLAALGAAAVQTAAVLAATLGSLHVLHLYRARVCAVRRVARRRLALAAAIGAASGWLCGLAMGLDPAALGAAVSGVALAGALVVEREIFEQWLRASRVRGHHQRSVLVVGTLTEVEQIVGLLEAHPEAGCRAAGWLGAYEGPPTTPAMVTVPWIGTTDQVLDAVVLTDARSTIVAPSVANGPELHALVGTLHAAGAHVQLWTGLWSVDHRRLHAAPIAHEPFFYLEPAGPSAGKLWAKRVIDVVVASIVLVLAAPVLAAAALAVKLGDGGPVLFRQERVGLDGRTFRLRKFRTMTVDAEQRLAALHDQNERTGPLFKLARDPRVTRVGRILRATSIDELPQLVDVIAGNLSLVGPRPALPDEVAAFDDELRRRHRVIPGVTGLWQVEARHNPSFYAYRHLDLFYVDNWTLGLDLVILLATAKTVASDGTREIWASVARRRKAATR